MAVIPGLLAMMAIQKNNKKKSDEEANKKIKGLIGTENQPYLLDADQQFEPGEQIPGLEIEGTGLLGGAGQFDPGNQTQFAGGLMQIPGMRDIGARMLTGVQDRYNKMLSGRLAGQLKRDNAEIQQIQNFGFKDQSQLNSAVNAWQAQHDKQTGPLRESLYKYQNVLQRVDVAGGVLDKMTGADDLMMTRAMIKMMSGGREAFMSDDQQAAMMAAQGFGTYDQVINMITGQGTLDAAGRQKMLDVMNTMAMQIQGTLEGERALVKRKLDTFGIPNDLVMRPSMDKILRNDFSNNKILNRKQKIIKNKKRQASAKAFGDALPPPPQGVQWADPEKNKRRLSRVN